MRKQKLQGVYVRERLKPGASSKPLILKVLV